MWAELAGVVIAGFGGFACATAWLAARPATVDPSPARRPLTLIRPCEGAEPRLMDALRPPREGVQVLACTTTTEDPAATIARAAGATVVLDDPATAGWTNPKARHLQAGLARAREEVVVLADADADVDGELLDRLVGALDGPGVSGAFAVPMAEARPAWGNRLLRSALGGSLYAWPALVALTRALGEDLPMSGALVAFRRADLPEGLAAAGSSIGDDLALASALQRRGRLVLIDRPVICAHGSIPLAEAVTTLCRWVHVAALHVPWRLLGYPAIFASTPLLLGMLLVTAALGMPLAGLPVLLALGLRARVGWTIRSRLLGDGPHLLDALLVEGVLLVAALRAAVALVSGAELQWRNRRYRVAVGGRILAVRTAP